MDKSYVLLLLERLKSTSSTQIEEALFKIKTNVINTEKGIRLFRKCGGFENLLPHLRKPNEKILDLTLSILGNLCLNEKCSLEVGKSNSFGPLITMLNTVSRDSLLGRVSRLIGNLAQIQSNAENLHNYEAVLALVSLIKNRDKGTSNVTLLMAVRAIRLLWMVQNKREEMLSLNVVHCVSALLVTECESMGIIDSQADERPQTQKKCQETLLNGILKCLGYFTTYNSEHCAKQIQGDGKGYLCLVKLMKRHEYALKCLFNLCYLQSCRPLLGNAGIILSLTEMLQKEPDVSQWPAGAARALSQLCREAVNRSRMRRDGALPLMLAAAKVDAHALRALLQFAFDDDSFQILIQEGLVGLLTERLTYYVSTMDYEHDVKETKAKSKEGSSKPGHNKKKCDLRLVIDKDGKRSVDNSENKEARRALQSDRKMLKRRNPLREDVTVVEAASSDSEEEICAGAQLVKAMKSPEQNEQMYCVSEGYSSGFSSEYGSSTSSKRARWDWSPESGLSAGECSTSPYRYAPWSPASSGPKSPTSAEDDSSDSEISGRYSPVCSEQDEEENNAASAKKGTESEETEAYNIDTLMIYGDSDEDDPPPEDICNANIDSSANVTYVVTLLFQVAAGGACSACGTVKADGPAAKLLAERECVNGLLDYVQKCRRPLGRAAKTLQTVVGNSLCLMNILKHRLPLRLHHMAGHTKHPPLACKQCDRSQTLSQTLMFLLTGAAESSYGVGQISHHLLKGTPSMKQTLALTLPYIVKKERTLKTLLIDCDALNILLNIVNESKEDLECCVTGLSNLAVSIRIKNPKLLEKRYKEHIVIADEPELDTTSDSDIVTFELDDSSTVSANRAFLCRHSEVFSAMLMGCFKESSERCVRLKNVSQSALKYLITLLQFGLNESKSDIKIFPVAENLSTSLEVLLLADRYLFDTLKDLLRSAILQFQLAPKTAHNIYTWSLEEGMGFLCVESVAYLLTGDMTCAERLKAFQNILNLEYKSQWLEDIKSILLRQLEK